MFDFNGYKIKLQKSKSALKKWFYINFVNQREFHEIKCSTESYKSWITLDTGIEVGVLYLAWIKIRLIDRV